MGILTWLFQRTGEPGYLRAAERAASFLTEVAWLSVPGIWPFEYPPDGDHRDCLAYFFDSGIIIRGLLALYRTTGDSKWLDAAVRGGDSMALFRHSGNPQVHHPVLRLPGLEPLEYGAQWSLSPGCYQLKSALAWLELAEATGREDFRAWWSASLEFALDDAPAFLPADTAARTMDRLHAFCYLLEALLFATERAEARSALTAGVRRVARYLREIRDEFERSDVNAQLLRVRLMADQLGVLPLDKVEAAEEVARIPGFQSESEDVRLAGGYLFGSRAGKLVPHSNPVSTAFCLQALEMFADYQNGIPLQPASLV